jgi:hypothetical protein
MQQVCDAARVTLNDKNKVRYPDATLLTAANEALALVRQKRPDYFIGSLDSAIEPLELAATLPGDAEVFPHLVSYVIGKASAADAEHVVSGRVQAFLTKFETDLMGR